MQERWPNHLKCTRELKGAFRRYDAAKRAYQVIDFDDMLVLWDQLLADQRIRHKVQSEFAHVIVDEYQDTNPLQDHILDRLRPAGRGLVVFGDDCQCICGYRGVEQGAVGRRGLTSTRLSLTRNFRASQPLLDACNAIFAASSDAKTKQLWSKKSQGSKPEFVQVRSEAMQARFVVERVELAVKNGMALREQAVLARTVEELNSFVSVLDQHKIPYRRIGGTRFDISSQIAAAIALLKWIENPADGIAAESALDMCRGIRPVYKAGKAARVRRKAGREQPQSSMGVSNDEWKRFKQLRKTMRRGSWSKQLTELWCWLCERKTNISGSAARSFIQFARTFKTRAQFLNAYGFGDEAYLSRPINADCLTLSTIHSAKGKEWTSVYIINAADGCLPIQYAASRKAKDEERRVMFVGLTRARQSFTLIMPRRLRRLGRSKVQLARTPFVPTRFLELYRVRTDADA